MKDSYVVNLDDLYIVTYYVWDSDFKDSLIYEVLIGSSFTCTDFVERHDFHNDRHGFGIMPLDDYLSSSGRDLDEIFSNIANFRV